MAGAAAILGPGGSGSAGASPLVQSVGKPVTEEECRAVGEQIGKAVSSGDSAALDRVINWGAIHERSTAGVDAPAKTRTDFIAGLAQAQAKKNGISAAIVDAVKKGGSYKLLHTHVEDKRQRVLFRLLLPDSSVNYHDYLLARQPDGKVRADDIYISMTGDLLSQTFRQVYLQVVARGSGGLLSRLTGADQKFVQFFQKLGAMNDARQTGEFAKMLDIYKSLPPELRKEKSILIVRLQAAQHLGDAEYKQSIEDFRAAYPNDASINMISIDYYLLNKQYPEALASIDRVDRAVLGDAHLQTIRAAVHIEMNDLAAARADAKKAIATEPGLVGAYWSLVTVALKDKDHDETLQTLRLIRDKFHLQMGDLTTVPLYADFTRSPQYQEWLKDDQTKGTGARGKPADKPQG